ncbi:hypothetical protein V8C43DRAFT_267241 [Trichoderma afarasin]
MPALECTCGRPFRSETDLKQHRKAKSRFICRRCNKCLASVESLKEHKAFQATCWENPFKDMQWRCNDCSAVFESRAASNQHVQATGHATEFRCRDCNKGFKSEKSLLDHLGATGHATEFRCCDCNKGFKSEKSLLDHLGAKDHGTPVAKPQTRKEAKEDRECKECNRTFKNFKALQQHLDSVIHRPISNLTCMAGKICGVECNAHFRSPSALVAHMENGTCRSGMNRQKLNRLVLMQDSEHLITSSDGSFESLGWASLENEPDLSSSGIMTPSTDSGEGVMLTPSSSQMDLMSLAGRDFTGFDLSDTDSDCTELPADGIYLCPLCPNSLRRFNGRKALEQHMQSPAHMSKIFHCPSILFQGNSGKSKPSMKKFSTISGLVAHIESGACRGGNAGLRTVMQYMEERLEDMGMSFKLLSI